MLLGFAQELSPKQRADGTIVAPLCSTQTSTGKSSQHLQRGGPREQRNLLPEHFHLRYHVQSNFWIILCLWGQERALRQRRKQQRWFHKPCVTPKASRRPIEHLKKVVCYLKTIIHQILFPSWWIIETIQNCASDSGNCWFCFKIASFRTHQHLCFPPFEKCLSEGLVFRVSLKRGRHNRNALNHYCVLKVSIRHLFKIFLEKLFHDTTSRKFPKVSF